MRIPEIRDPQLFQELVSALLVAERGAAIQLVDDSGGDGGLDGYDTERHVLYAFYCPEKPANDARYLGKALSDLKKAQVLRDEGEYEIETFAFVTPQHVREPVLRRLRAEAGAVGLGAISIGAVHLDQLLAQHPSVQKCFPQLSYPDIQASIAALGEKIDALGTATVEETSTDQNTGQDAPGIEARLFSGLAFPRLFAIQQALLGGDEAKVAELEQVRMESAHPEERLAATMVEVQFEGDRMNFARVVELAPKGVALAKAIGNEPVLAVLLAEQGRALSMQLVEEDMAVASQVAAGNRVGFPLLSEVEYDRATKRLDGLRIESERIFNDALANAWKRPNVEAVFMVLLLYANAMTQRIFPFKFLQAVGELPSHSAEMAFFKHQAEGAYETAAQAAVALGDDRFLSMAYSNFANDLVVFEELDRAEAHARRALAIGEELGDEDLISRPRQILEVVARDRGPAAR